MELTKNQNRYINNKKLGFTLIKGGKCSGKTTALVLRLINLENNYCIYEDDQILFVCNKNNELNFIKDKYLNLKDDNKFYSLFSLTRSKVNFNTIEQLIDSYSRNYQNREALNCTYLSKNELLTKLNSSRFKDILDEKFRKSRLIQKMSLEEVYNEILWIKACDFKEDEYMSTERKGKKIRINKNSLTRKFIYSSIELYNEFLRSNGYIDRYDKINFAIRYSKTCTDKYAHLFIDDIQALTKVEIDFANSLSSKSSGASINFALNNEDVSFEDTWFIKGRNIKTISTNSNVKSFIFKGNLSINKCDDLMEKYQYIDFKHKNISEFNMDRSINGMELYLRDELCFSEKELLNLPVFNDIAAGNPIEISDGVVGSFYLPEVWIGKSKNIFVLTVKGDSMVGKNIDDSDLIVIKKQQTASHNDIVAASVDGEATLKVLNTKGDFPTLVSANEKYRPISLIDREVSIIGVAIGVIKQIN